jgi:uncharacterized protein (DUF433 family)
MQLEDYFDFLDPNDIRIKGHRIGIETVLYEYIYRERTPEQIARRYSTLTLEEVYATILYYLRNKEAVSQYMADWLEHGRRVLEEQERTHPEWLAKMRRLMAEYQAGKKARQ